MNTLITLTADRRAMCVRAAYKHRDIMLDLPAAMRRGVRDETGFWWRVALAAKVHELESRCRHLELIVHRMLNGSI